MCYNYIYLAFQLPLEEKIEIIAKKIYGAAAINILPEAQVKLDRYKKQVCYIFFPFTLVEVLNQKQIWATISKIFCCYSIYCISKISTHPCKLFTSEYLNYMKYFVKNTTIYALDPFICDYTVNFMWSPEAVNLVLYVMFRLWLTLSA